MLSHGTLKAREHFENREGGVYLNQDGRRRFFVAYAVFECRLEAETFELFWKGMQAIIDPDMDRIVAYRICAACARAISTAGVMSVSGDVVAYVM